MKHEAGNGTRDRAIRLFVSSAFRDMQAERDELLKRIFPQIKTFCENRQVAFGEVDLRWGITEEQSMRGEIIECCLEEIDRCRPYFIGLLGDYYGTLAKDVGFELRPRPGWPKDFYERSLTELEIVHGVLANPTPPITPFSTFAIRHSPELCLNSSKRCLIILIRCRTLSWLR